MRYGRVPGGFEMFATAINDGAGCQFRQRRDDVQGTRRRPMPRSTFLGVLPPTG